VQRAQIGEARFAGIQKFAPQRRAGPAEDFAWQRRNPLAKYGVDEQCGLVV
jgi:hypothetical protein